MRQRLRFVERRGPCRAGVCWRIDCGKRLGHQRIEAFGADDLQHRARCRACRAGRYGGGRSRSQSSGWCRTACVMIGLSSSRCAFVGGFVHQAVELALVGDLHLEEPRRLRRIGVHQRGLGGERVVDLDDFAGERRVDVGGGLDRFDDGGGFGLLQSCGRPWAVRRTRRRRAAAGRSR